MSGWRETQERGGTAWNTVWCFGDLRLWQFGDGWRWAHADIKGPAYPHASPISAADLAEAQRLATLAAHAAIDAMKAALPPLPEET